MRDVTDRLNAALQGRYEIMGKLGEGGMANVYLADDLRHERKVALKVLKAELAEAVGSRRFLAEIKTTANLQHPHILPLFDSGEADGFLFYVMPYVEGESLGDRLERESTLPVDEAVRITALVASALQYAHDQGVIHRDVKPANIMLSGDLPVVADFGIALAIKQAGDLRLTSPNEATASLLYGSPEQLMAEGSLDGRSDLYSLACVLYELLTGQCPHEASTPAAVIGKRLSGPPPAVRTLRADVPEYLNGLIDRCLAVDPSDRYASVKAFSDALLSGKEQGSRGVLKDIGNLPSQATSLIGREEALADVESLLDGVRLVTLLGTGGMGKTRLAIESARRTSSEFPDGTWFVDLAAVTDANAVGNAAAGVFGVTQQGGKSIEQSLADALGGRRLLMVLDNCEHVVGAAGSLARALLASCADVKIIATSREALSIAGEHVWPVPALDVLGEEAPATKLFVERARGLDPSFQVGEHGSAISEICRSLDGIPLAIELAAARVRSLSPTQIVARLGERFRLLTRGARGSEIERHQTLRHAVQWSYDLLSEAEKAVLGRATVFAGGFTLDAAEYVCAGEEMEAFEVLDVLDALVGKSLLTVDRSRDQVRYGMLETIRSFGGERLTERAEEYAVRLRHGNFYAEQSGENFEIWRSPRELEAYEWLDAEIGNLRVAFRWALENEEIDVAARIASDVGDMGRFRLHEEAAFWAEEVVDMARAAKHPRLAVLLTWSASSAWAFSRFEDAQRFGEEAIALRDDPAYDPFIWAYGDLAFVAMFAGDVDRAIELFRRGSEHPTDRRDRFMMGFLLYVMGTAGHCEDALRVADDYLEQVDEVGIPMSIAVGYAGKGAALEGTNPEAALAAYEHSVAAARNSGNRFMEALIAPRVAALHARSGEPMVALKAFERMLVTFGEMTDIASVSAWRASLAVLLGKLGHHEAAATLHGTFADAIDTAGVVPEHAEAIEGVRSKLGDAAFSTAATRGAKMSLREASNYAIEQVRLGLEGFDEHLSGGAVH